ncbi:MAG: nitrate- and nitrite sensing domain-containing protein [Streptosporangiaceae bacterium]
MGKEADRPRAIRLRNWRVAPRLVALVAIPATVAVALAGVRVSGSVADVMTYQRAERFITLGDSMDAVVDALELERTRTVLYVGSGPAGSKSRLGLQSAQTKVDEAIRNVQNLDVDVAESPQLATAVSTAMNRLVTVPALRAIASRLPATAVINKYSEFTADVIAVGDLIIQGSENAFLTSGARAMAGLARAKDAASQENDRITAALLSGRFEPSSLQAVTAARSQRDNQLIAFRAAADLTRLQDFDDTVAGSGLDRAETTRQRVVTVAGDSPELKVRPLGLADVPGWLTDSSTRIEKIEEVEERLIDALAERSRTLQSDAKTAAMLDSLFLLLVLIAVLIATLVVANSLVRPLRRLRAGALEVAEKRLPELVSRLRNPEAAAGRINVEPIDIDTTDEIGQVARAFDDIHREAVRLAANEAVLRGDISAMFVNLSRRSQSLIERQLRLIDELEQGEQDEERLAALFRLDHLATRMRRNCENLLVLGGQDQVRRWNRPVPLLNVVRAALSEVEQFDRVELRIQNEVSIGGPVVNDLVHLIAELIENAIVFSPEHTPITVSGSLISGGLMVQITDQGVGMSHEELAEANLRLKSMPATDVSAARRMGLFVVGRLATRHGIRVELRPTTAGGVTAFALLPAGLVSIAGDPALAGPPMGQQGHNNNAFGQQQQRHLPAAPQPPALAPVQSSYTNPVQVAQQMPAPQFAQHQQFPNQFAQNEQVPNQYAPSQQAPGQQVQPVPNALARPTWRNPPQQESPQMPVPVASHSGANGGRREGDVWRSSPAPEPVQAPEQRWQPAAAPPPWEPPAPAVPAPRPEASPIFEAMTSEWFVTRDATGRASMPDPETWRSPADEGWQLAESTSINPASSGRTTTGLPKRVPGQNRLPGAVPGAATPQPPQRQPQQQPQQQPQRPAEQAPTAQPAQEWPLTQGRFSADARRARFGGFQRGVQRGRTEAGSGSRDAESQTGSETGENT